MEIKFYDTSSLLLKVNTLFEDKENFIISSTTLHELEKIKTSFNEDPEVKYTARQLLHKLEENYGSYTVIPYKECYNKYIEHYSLNNDLKILACACAYQDLYHSQDLIFITNDLSLKHLARVYFGNKVESVKEEQDDYDGYKEVILNDEEMTNFYQFYDKNHFDLKVNEYLIVKDKENNIVDTLRWTGEEYQHLKYDNFNSDYLGKIKPIKGDIYQALAVDSLINNKITMIKGPAGSGKSTLSLAYLFHKLEKGHIDKIIVFCNTVATKNSARLGFYPGSKDEKLLDSQIGNFLSSKMGGKIIVEQLIKEEKLVLLPMSDIRGYDTTGMRAGIYISEAQNLDIELMKLALQRIGEDSICIIDGDCKAQVDDIAFAGNKNGMRRVSKVFRGHDVYGEVNLKIIHRSKIAEIADKL